MSQPTISRRELLAGVAAVSLLQGQAGRKRQIPPSVSSERKIEVEVSLPDLKVHHRRSYLQYPRQKASGD